MTSDLERAFRRLEKTFWQVQGNSQNKNKLQELRDDAHILQSEVMDLIADLEDDSDDLDDSEPEE